MPVGEGTWQLSRVQLTPRLGDGQTWYSQVSGVTGTLTLRFSTKINAPPTPVV